MPREDRRPPRVLMTADAVGGVWTYALDLAEALGERGVRLALATMGPAPSEAQRAQAARLGNIELHVGSYKLEWMEDPWEDVTAAGNWLLELEDRFHPDVIHLNGFVHAILPWRSPVLVVGHSCVWSWHEAVHGCEPAGPWQAYRAAVAAGLSAADAVTAPTAAMMRALARHYGTFAATTPIPNGRRPGLFAPRRKEPLVLAAGRLWDEAKNVAALRAAAPRLAWPVYVAGEERLSAGEGPDLAGLHPLGRLGEEELADWMGRAAIFAAPARYEPFGLCALEAGLCGCALVLGNLASLREVWADAAVYVDPDDPEALAATINRLCVHPERLRRLGGRARERALQFQAAPMADRYLTLYESLARASEPRITYGTG